jgi:DUF1009 family protein
MDYLAGQGIETVDPLQFLAKAFCAEGVLTDEQPTAWILSDIQYGWPVARKLADADIGQSVLVKHHAVVAVEGIEGTDAAVERAGRLAGAGCVLIKVGRTRQDPRIDLPAVGLETIKSLAKAKAGALCFEADRMPFFHRRQSTALADRNHICIIAKK